MTPRWLLAGALALGFWLAGSMSAHAQYPTSPQAPNQPLNQFYYYPYYYFPHSYWPTQSPPWPEPVGAPYMRPPAYMAYPPFKEPGWRYDLFEPHHYYRGFHFWLDQF
jgi:hypothetical protein